MCPCAMGLTYRPMRTLAAFAIVVLAAALLAGCGERRRRPRRPGAPRAGFDAERAFADLEAQVELGPRPSGSAAAHGPPS